MSSAARYSCLILIKLEFLNSYSKNSQIANLKKIRPLGTEMFHADGRTDMTKLNVAFPILRNPL